MRDDSLTTATIPLSSLKFIREGSVLNVFLRGQPNADQGIPATVISVSGCTVTLNCAVAGLPGSIVRLESESHIFLAEVRKPAELPGSLAIEIVHILHKQYLEDLRKLWF